MNKQKRKRQLNSFCNILFTGLLACGIDEKGHTVREKSEGRTNHMFSWRQEVKTGFYVCLTGRSC